MNPLLLLCKLGFHTGRKQGGTMRYTCRRCKRSVFQPKDLRWIASQADTMLHRGEPTDKVMSWVAEMIRRNA